MLLLKLHSRKRPITIVLSSMGWIRGMKGHGLDMDSTKFKDGDSYYLHDEVFTHRQDYPDGQRWPLIHPALRQATRRARTW